MIIFFDFGINLREYETARGTENDFPEFEWCPSRECVGSGNIHLNGFYWRYGITEEVEAKIPIRRMCCLNCKVSISVLPDFLIPHLWFRMSNGIILIKLMAAQRQAV